MGCRITAGPAILALLVVTVVGCGGDAGPPEGFDVTGTWSERGGDSSLQFTDTCGYNLRFRPALSDGTMTFGGERYERIDNATVGFRMVMGVGTIEVIEVEARISGSEVLTFDLDGRTFSFEKTSGGSGVAPVCPVRPDGDTEAEPRTEVADVAIDGTPLPESFGSDAQAAGALVPELRGVDFDNSPVEITADGRKKMILVVAHWDPHGQAVIPELVAWINGGGLPGDVDLYVVSTAVDPERGNYPPSAWLAREGVTAPVLVDDAAWSAAHALGTAAFPYFVFATADGTLAGVYVGGLYGDPPTHLDDLVAGYLGG